MARRTAWPLWLPRLSMMTMSPGLSVGEELLDIGFEAFAVDRSIKDARRVDPVVPQGRKECERLPMPVRRLSAQALPSQSPAAGADHVGLGPSLIDEDEAGRINLSLMRFPA